MRDVITNLLDVPFARMFVLAGIIFLIIAVLGKFEFKIDPGNVGRLGSTALGIGLLFIGIAMQYIEIREVAMNGTEQQPHLESQNQPQNATVAPVSGVAAIQAPDAPPAVKPAIKVVSGTFGRNCNAKAGNATQQIASACDGKPACDYAVEPVELENAPANCARDFAAEWKCGSANTIYSAILPVGAGTNEKLHLACAG